MKRDKIKNLLGFTLIELLIVIGILAILTVSLLFALNPAEIQKRARDERRIKDATTIATVLDQYINDGQSFTGSCLDNGGVCVSVFVGQSTNAPQPCNNNWLKINVCAYAQTIPIDPANHWQNQRTFISGATPGNFFQQIPFYTASVVGSDYEVEVMLESEANRRRVVDDGGASTPDVNDRYFQVGSNLSLIPF